VSPRSGAGDRRGAVEAAREREARCGRGRVRVAAEWGRGRARAAAGGV